MAVKGKGTPVPWDEISDSSIFPVSDVHANIESLENQPSKKGYKMFVLAARITAPKELKGQIYYDRYCVGNEDDPEAMDPVSWTGPRAVAARRWKKLLGKAGVALKGTAEDACERAVGREVGLHITQRQAKGGPREGELENEADFFEAGAREPRILGFVGAKSAVAAPPKKRPAPVVVEEEEDDEEEEAEAPPPKKVKKSPPPSDVPEDDDEEEDENEDEDDDDLPPATSTRRRK